MCEPRQVLDSQPKPQSRHPTYPVPVSITIVHTGHPVITITTSGRGQKSCPVLCSYLNEELLAANLATLKAENDQVLEIVHLISLPTSLYLFPKVPLVKSQSNKNKIWYSHSPQKKTLWVWIALIPTSFNSCWPLTSRSSWEHHWAKLTWVFYELGQIKHNNSYRLIHKRFLVVL